MKKRDRYWEADTPPDDALRDWVCDNVKEAVRYFWYDDPPTAHIDRTGKRLSIVFTGPPRPTKKDPFGGDYRYFKEFDLLSLLSEYGNPYGDLGGLIGDEQRQDVRDRAAVLTAFSNAVARLASQALEEQESGSVRDSASVSILNLYSLSKNRLSRNGINRIGELVALTLPDLQRILGRKGADEAVKALATHGRALREDER